MSIRRRLNCSLATALTLCCAVGAYAQSKDKVVEGLIDKAINKHYYATEFDAAESLLREANMECADQCSKKVQARVWMYLGIVLSGKNDPDGAREAFRSARKANPELELDPDFAGPKTEKLFEEAGEEKKTEPKKPAQVAAEPEPELEPEPDSAGFGRSGQLVLAADRLFGFYLYKFSVGAYTDPSGVAPEENHSGSTLAFLGSGGTTPSVGSNPGMNPFAAPRVGFDFFVTESISVGGGLSYASGSIEEETSTAEASVSAFGLQLRGGYALAFSPLFGLWPRGGFSLATLSAESGAGGTTVAEASYSMYDFTVEVPVVISPVDHFGFSVGPVIDIALGGKMTTSPHPVTGAPGEVERNIAYTSYGLAAGLFGTL